MPRHTLYAYVDGSDLDAVAAALEARFEEFVSQHTWIAGRAWVVNQRHAEDGDAPSGELALWDLGMNLELPDPGTEVPGWFADLEAVTQFLGELRRDYGRDFVMGIADAPTHVTEDLFHVDTNSPDLNDLRAVIGVGVRKINHRP